MNKQKKNIVILIVILGVLFLSGATALLLAGSNAKEVIAKAENQYAETYNSYCTFEHDEDISIDGVLDETYWAGKTWLTDTYYNNTDGSMPRLKVTGFTTEYGIYVASVVEDTNLVNDGQRTTKMNSNFEINVAVKKDGEELKNGSMYRKTFIIDMCENVTTSVPNIDRAVVVDGELNSGATKSATLELFIPWDSLQFDVSKGVPKEFWLLPSYYAVLPEHTTTTKMITHFYNGSRPKDFYLFDEKGYVNVDREGAVVGDSKFGQAKTGNWDISKEKDGIVQSSTGTERHRIFFTEAYGSNFIVETTIIPVRPLENAWPKAGIYFQSTDADEGFHAVFLELNEARLVKRENGSLNPKNFALTTLNNKDNGWHQKSVLEKSVENKNAMTQEGVKLTVVKYEEQFMYFANGEFLAVEQNDFMKRDVIPGFYALGCDAIYKNYSCTAIDKDGLKQYLNKKGFFVIDAKAASAGGSVETSTFSVGKGESYGLTITSNSGYRPSSVLINGKEMISSVKKNTVDGIYTVSDVKANQEVRVSFEKCSGYKLSGLIKDGEEALAAKVILIGKTNKQLRYEATSTGKKGYNMTVPVGTYQVHVIADNENYVKWSESITIKSDKTKDFAMKLTTFPKTVEVNGKKINSSLTRWDLSQEYAKKISGSLEMGSKMLPLYFSKTAKDFVVETTINYTTDFSTGKKEDFQDQLWGGFMFSDGKNSGWLMAVNHGISYTNWKFAWSLYDQSVLIYPDKKPVKLTLVKLKDMAYIYFNDRYVYEMKWSDILPNSDANSEVAIGLSMLADRTADIQFSNYKLQTTSSAASKYIKEHALTTKKLAANPLFAEAVAVNKKYVKSNLDKWDLSDVSNGNVMGSHKLGSKLQAMYFTEHGSSALIKTKIEYTTKFVNGQVYQEDLCGGIAFSNGKQSGWLMVRNKGIVYTNWKYQDSLVNTRYLTHWTWDLAANPKPNPVNLTIAVFDDDIYIYFNDLFVCKKKVSAIVPGATSGQDLAYGLTMIADKTADIKFSEISITTDVDKVTDYIKGH